MHVAMADAAVLLGPARARDSYLNIEARALRRRKKTGAEAIHPGYGFLSENAEFAEACAKAGIVFVGPTAAMMTAMGSKSGSKALMEKAGVPLVPGYHGDAQDEATLAKAAEKVGFPVLVKASAGGGGRGMRVVRSAAELAPAIVSAKREAKAAFGDDRMLIEKYVDNPRHIEVQIIGDSHGNLLSLFERECTLQRRHQKVIEEAPSPTLERQATRGRLRSGAQGGRRGQLCRRRHHRIRLRRQGRVLHRDEHPPAGRASRDRTDHRHRSRRMAVARGLRRKAAADAGPDQAERPRHRGAGLRGKPAEEFHALGRPHQDLAHACRRSDGLRIDAGYRSGDAVSPYYDAMLAKVIAWAPTRDVAIDKLNRGLEETDVRGIVTNIPFLSALVTHPKVRANAIDTGFIERELTALTETSPPAGDLELCAAVAAILVDEQKAAQRGSHSPWQTFGWMPVGRRQRVFSFRQGAGRRAEGDAALWQRAADAVDRQARDRVRVRAGAMAAST